MASYDEKVEFVHTGESDAALLCRYLNVEFTPARCTLAGCSLVLSEASTGERVGIAFSEDDLAFPGEDSVAHNVDFSEWVRPRRPRELAKVYVVFVRRCREHNATRTQFAGWMNNLELERRASDVHADPSKMHRPVHAATRTRITRRYDLWQMAALRDKLTKRRS